MIEKLYLITGLLLPLFYIPQVFRLYKDNTQLKSFSLLKACAQLILRIPALIFAYFIVKSEYMNIVLTADILGRSAEFAVALISLKRQGVNFSELSDGIKSNLKMSLSKFIRLRKPSATQESSFQANSENNELKTAEMSKTN